MSDPLNQISVRELAAQSKGYTRRILVSGGMTELELLVEPDSDLDGTFRAWDCAEEEWLTVNGWLMDSLEDL